MQFQSDTGITSANRTGVRLINNSQRLGCSRAACVEVVSLMTRCLPVVTFVQLRHPMMSLATATCLSSLSSTSQRCYPPLDATQDSRAGKPGALP
ncbi:hypothetical protein C1N62_02780 [Nissabacter sp. SGAir0207]|nr:hypothetical protein C1N62_02780 [Nissabacter sp. SGAir0207]